MVNYERVAEKIFSIIKGHGHTLSMYKVDGMDTTDAAEARRFFVAKPNYMITLDEEASTIKINKNSNLELEDLEGIMKQMKNLARENMLNTQVKVFGKEITPKDFAYQAKKFKDASMNESNEPNSWQVLIPANVFRGKYFESSRISYYIPLDVADSAEEAIDYVWDNQDRVYDKYRGLKGYNNRFVVAQPVEKNIFFRDKKRMTAKPTRASSGPVTEASLSRMSGSKKTSYQTLESVKMIVRHRKAVDEDVRGSRSRQISAIFLEQAGERFRFPHNHLAGARAMARHMYEGGNMQDTIGEYIVESVSNMIKLNEFVRYARSNKLMNEANEDVVKTVKENIATLRSELKGLTGAKSYAKISEAIAAREASVLEEDDTADLQDMFTVRKFDEKITTTLPLVRRLMNEKQAWRDALVEASQQTIYMSAKEELAEEDIMEFDSPIQQVGYKIGKIAKRMVESGDLSNFVAKVAGKLIEGQKINEFEQTVVRNVMKNATIAEEKEECVDEEKEEALESAANQFELKMKMIEHEELFDEGYDDKFKTVHKYPCSSCALEGRTECSRWCPQGKKGAGDELFPDEANDAYYKDLEEAEGDTCIRCRKGTMEVGDTMMGAQEKCNRCGYQHAVREGIGSFVGKKVKGYVDNKLIKQIIKVLDNTMNPVEAAVAFQMNMDEKQQAYTLKVIKQYLTDNPESPDFARLGNFYGMAGGEHFTTPVDEGEYDDHHAGEMAAGAHSGMPSTDDSLDQDHLRIVDLVMDDLQWDEQGMGADEILELVIEYFPAGEFESPAIDKVYTAVMDRLNYKGESAMRENEWSDFNCGDDCDEALEEALLDENTCQRCDGKGYDDEDEMGLCPSCDGSGKKPQPKKYSSS